MEFIKYTSEQLIAELKKYKHKKLHIHHTYIPTHKQFTGTNHDAMQTGMRNFHVNTKKWDDIAQHATLFPDGVFLKGRDFNKTPVSIYNHNFGAFAVEMVGNFDIKGTGEPNIHGYDVLKDKQLTSILDVIRYFVNTRGQSSIMFHSDASDKTCPGTSLDKQKLIDMAIKTSWEQAIMDTASSPESWIKAINLIVDMVAITDNLDLKIVKHLPELVVKLYER